MDRYNSRAVDARTSLNTQISRVFGWMFLGLAVSGVTAFLTISSPLSALVTNGYSLLILVLAEFGLVFYLSARAMKMEYVTAAGAFLLYAVLNGITLSMIFYVYTAGSIALVFFLSAAFFGFMSVYGLVTRTDLSAYGSLLIMGLFGIILASVVNLFLRSQGLYWLISYIGVAVFLGLTAYDSQKIKEIHFNYAGTDRERNVGIVGALTLYLDFINLFLFVLRILGKRR